MTDFQDLYRTEEFEETFQRFFDLKIPYRELMISRSKFRQKRNYMKVIRALEQAFKSKVFVKLNRQTTTLTLQQPVVWPY